MIITLSDYLRNNQLSKRYVCVSIFMRFDLPVDSNYYGFKLDVQCMPVYCHCCKKTLANLYCHCSSYHGLVGEIICDKCRSTITVVDHDHMVSTIIYSVKDFGGDEFDFSELYKMHWKYLSQLEQNKNISLSKIFSDMKQNKSITIKEVLERLQKETGESVTGNYQYMTDEHFDILPKEVNGWIELLDICGVQGIYLSKQLASSKPRKPLGSMLLIWERNGYKPF